jgi:hypothetical protein
MAGKRKGGGARRRAERRARERQRREQARAFAEALFGTGGAIATLDGVPVVLSEDAIINGSTWEWDEDAERAEDERAVRAEGNPPRSLDTHGPGQRADLAATLRRRDAVVLRGGTLVVPPAGVLPRRVTLGGWEVRSG